MITIDMLLFSTVENKGFRKLMSVIEPDYKVPWSNTIIVHFEKMYDDKMMDLKRNLENVKGEALTTDGWTSQAVDSYITFTCHYFNENWGLCTQVLGFEEMRESHSVDNIQDSLINIIET